MLNITAEYQGNQATELIHKPLFRSPELQSLFTVKEDVQYREPLNIISPLKNILKKYVSCGFNPTAGSAAITQRFLEPQRMKAEAEECADIFEETIWTKKQKKDPDSTDLTGTELLMLLTELATEALIYDTQRVVWFGDTASDDDDFDQIDGAWKKLFAGADTGVALDDRIPSVSIPDTLVAGSAYTVFKNLIKAADPILKQALHKMGGMILCTGELFDNYVESKEGDKGAGTDLAFNATINGIAAEKLGAESLPFRGLPVIAMRDWDTQIAAEELDNTHRAVLWVPGNHFIGTDAKSSWNQFRTWYSPDADKNRFRARLRLDYNYAIAKYVAIAFSEA